MRTRIVVIGPKDKPIVGKNDLLVNTTSRSKDFGQELSPFFLGPCKLWGGHVAQNMENAWQYSKVYPLHLSAQRTVWDEKAKERWLNWAKVGWKDKRAYRYPMGKGHVPSFSFWNGQKLDYVTARREIYIPLYARAVKKTTAFKMLRHDYESNTFSTIYLWDFDGYDHRSFNMNLLDVMAAPDRKMGHAFVLAMMLQWGKNFYRK